MRFSQCGWASHHLNGAGGSAPHNHGWQGRAGFAPTWDDPAPLHTASSSPAAPQLDFSTRSLTYPEQVSQRITVEASVACGDIAQKPHTAHSAALSWRPCRRKTHRQDPGGEDTEGETGHLGGCPPLSLTHTFNGQAQSFSLIPWEHLMTSFLTNLPALVFFLGKKFK